jgi:glycosyltransferase involved in cell wall biosynthesis
VIGAATSRLRVLMVTARFPPYSGGIETHVREVAPRLAGLGIDVEVLTTDPSGELPSRERIDGVEVVRIPAYPRDRDYYFAPAIPRHLRSGRYDLVHLQGYHTLVAPLTMYAARRARTPYVVSFHSGGHTARLRRMARGLQRMALRPGFRSAARLVAVSQFELDLFRRSLRLRPSRFVLIRNGCRMPPPSTAPDPRVPLVLSVGRLERYKGHHRLVAAWPHVMEQRPSAQLRILGVGRYEAELHRQVEALGLSASVEIGSIPPGDPQAMSDAMGGANLVALLSDYEAHPLAVVEALAVGRPVLVSESSGLREIVAAGLARGVPDAAAPDEVARAILRQLDEPLVVSAAALPTWDDCAAQLHDLYRSVLG